MLLAYGHDYSENLLFYFATVESKFRNFSQVSVTISAKTSEISAMHS